MPPSYQPQILLTPAAGRAVMAAARARLARMLRPDGTCLLWTGPLSPDGYGRFVVGYAGSIYYARAHRVAVLLAGRTIPPGQVVRHTCDRPACCNPAHLRVGTHAQNVQDRVTRGRTAHGERHWRARLREVDVREILASSETTATLAQRFGVSPGQITEIRGGRSWRHIARGDRAA